MCTDSSSSKVQGACRFTKVWYDMRKPGERSGNITKNDDISCIYHTHLAWGGRYAKKR